MAKLPAPLATISEKYHTPIVAITVTTIVNLIFMALFVFTATFSKIVILIEAAVLAWSVVLGFLAVLLVFRTTDWRGLIKEAEAEAESEKAAQTASP